MENVTKLVDKYGPELTRSLGIASTQLYSKLLWYVRMGGIMNLVTDVASLLIGAVLILVVYKLKKRAVKNPDATVSYYVFSLTIVLGIWVVLSFVVSGIMNDAVKAVFPEYWVIDQAVNKLMTK